MDDDVRTVNAVPYPVALVMDTDISPGAKQLWGAMWLFGATEGSMTYEAKMDFLMSWSAASKNSVIKWRKELVDTGWLEEVTWRGMAQKNVYTVKTDPTQHSPVDQV